MKSFLYTALKKLQKKNRTKCTKKRVHKIGLSAFALLHESNNKACLILYTIQIHE